MDARFRHCEQRLEPHRRCPACEPKWRRLPGVVTHVFTHFPLELTVYAAEVAASTPAPEGARWVPLATLAGEALPNVMRKVLAHAGLELRRVD